MLGQSQSTYQLIPKCEVNYYKKCRRTDQQAEHCTNAHFTSDVPKTWLANHQWSAKYIQVDCEQRYIPH